MTIRIYAIWDGDGRFQKGERRSPATEFKPGQHWRPRRRHWDREWLAAEYVDKCRSAAEIADEIGCTEPGIRYWLRKHDIPIRSISEARSVKRWVTPSGPANPMYGRRGPASPAFVDGGTPERQRLYARSEWRQTVKAIYARDGYCCQRCGAGHDREHPLHAHHIKTWAGNPDLRSDLDNLITLCRPCHKWVHSNANAEREFLS